ncbi:MAG TPA: YbhB/YbcL family Raf kinase inhibitor-like protein [Solirubrobacteraceae bacterium]|nr:YbhB/YbcL family Raf kinase inhibitor-like protein [Solirubrobacteraceae bacterium]HSD81951.1 YbhB/YbcL family Raf kinase inhibitor-like protein [Solirubrobacteraceae bacterium]
MAGALAASLALAGCGSSGETVKEAVPEPPATLRLAAPGAGDGAVLDARFTCDGAGARPALRWSRPPPAARELAVLVTDPDAPGGTFVHWSVFGLAPSVRALGPAGLPPGAAQGRNGFGDDGWGAPCPPRGGGRHRYVFSVYWLRERSGLPAGASGPDVVRALDERAGGRGTLTLTYERGE